MNCTSLGNCEHECYSFGESDEEKCPKSEKECEHHCNHSWTHDSCCWCKKNWESDFEPEDWLEEVN